MLKITVVAVGKLKDVSDELRDKVVAASIYDDVEGSDHCPVGLELDI